MSTFDNDVTRRAAEMKRRAFAWIDVNSKDRIHTDVPLNEFVDFICNKAAIKEMDAAYSGESTDGGARVFLNTHAAWLAGYMERIESIKPAIDEFIFYQNFVSEEEYKAAKAIYLANKDIYD